MCSISWTTFSTRSTTPFLIRSTEQRRHGWQACTFPAWRIRNKSSLLRFTNTSGLATVARRTTLTPSHAPTAEGTLLLGPVFVIVSIQATGVSAVPASGKEALECQRLLTIGDCQWFQQGVVEDTTLSAVCHMDIRISFQQIKIDASERYFLKSSCVALHVFWSRKLYWVKLRSVSSAENDSITTY